MNERSNESKNTGLQPISILTRNMDFSILAPNKTPTFLLKE